ncbi:MAG: DUF459 domain-containing protein, partial [Alphaproteobacteria bacterium]
MVMWRSIIGLVMVVLLCAVPASGAWAQERSTRTLFEVLFGSGNEQQQSQPQAPVTSQPRPQAQPAPQPQQAPTPAPTEVEKSENARRVAVFVDSLAVDLARALERLYADNPEIMVAEEAVGSSGFVRDD